MTEAPLVLVHGLWFRARFLGALQRRLARNGFRVHPFNYHTTRQPLHASAADLATFCRRHAPAGAHLVGHSLGGLLILEMLRQGAWQAPGRLLLLGTPLRGSAVVQRVANWPGMDRLFGHAGDPLHTGQAAWPQGREVGMIAGTRRFGLGLLTGSLDSPHDGTVAVSETRHPGINDRIELPVTHTGMIFSGEVARQAAAFLRTGSFER